VDQGIVASFMIVCPTSVANAALNSSGAELASVYIARLTADNGSVLLNAIKEQVKKSSSAASLLALFENTTIANIDIVLVSSVPPSPTYLPTSKTVFGNGNISEFNNNLGLYIGIPCAAIFFIALVVVGYFFLFKKRTVTKVTTAIETESTNMTHVFVECNSEGDIA